MIRRFADIEVQFRHARMASLVVALMSVIISCWAIYSGYQHANRAENRIYILSAGKAMDAIAAERGENLEVEAKDHIRQFHFLFFTLDPNEKANMENIKQAFELADQSAKTLYDNLREAGFYAGIVSGNISERIRMDSVAVDFSRYPYPFHCYATEQLIRTFSVTTRRLVTMGWLRNIQRSESCPHGLLIERLTVITNEDINTKTR